MKVKLLNAFLIHYSPLILSARKQPSAITISQDDHLWILPKHANFVVKYLLTKKLRKKEKKRNKILLWKLHMNLLSEPEFSLYNFRSETLFLIIFVVKYTTKNVLYVSTEFINDQLMILLLHLFISLLTK